MEDNNDQKTSEEQAPVEVIPLTEEEIDNLLAEEDPEFLKQLSEIQIDNDVVDLSVIGSVINPDGSLSSGYGRELSFQNKLRMMFQIQENPKLVLSFWLTVLALGCFIYLLFQSNLLSSKSSLFLTSFAEYGAPVYTYDLQNDVEPFFDNSKLSKNLITINRMVANLKASENSSDNPMLALELNIEGLSTEVVIEIKDREAEFKDIILREVEEFTYDDLVDVPGKMMLSDRILNLINANLTKGQIRKVLYKSFVLKN